MSFLFFYIFVLLAYSYGLFIIMSGVPNLLTEFPTLQEVMFELLLVGCGVDSRMSSDTIGKEFDMAGYNPLFFHLLFTSYILVTLVGLLNLVIASMVDSYQKFTETDNQGWLQHSLKMTRNSEASYQISSQIFRPLFKCLKIIDRKVREEIFKDLEGETFENGKKIDRTKKPDDDNKNKIEKHERDKSIKGGVKGEIAQKQLTDPTKTGNIDNKERFLGDDKWIHNQNKIQSETKTGHFIIEMSSKQAHSMIEKLSAGK